MKQLGKEKDWKEEIDWEDVLDTLNAEKCVLFLGGGIFDIEGHADLNEALLNWLDAENTEHPLVHLFNSDGFVVLQKPRYKRRLANQIKRFYEQAFPNTEAVMSMLAEMPFSLIVSLTPDNLLGRTFEKLRLPYYSDFYVAQQKSPKSLVEPNREVPLIYNLLGNVEDPESLILTHGDFFDFLSSVFTGHQIGDSLKDKISEMERFIFLGLPYEKWYFQILLRVLALQSENFEEIERLALIEFQDNALNKLYTNEFKIEFFPLGIKEFVEKLHTECRKAGMLKSSEIVNGGKQATTTSQQILIASQIESLIAEARISEALNILRSLSEEPDVNYEVLDEKEVIILQNRFNLLQQREQRGTIFHQDYQVEHARISEQVLDLTISLKR